MAQPQNQHLRPARGGRERGAQRDPDVHGHSRSEDSNLILRLGWIFFTNMPAFTYEPTFQLEHEETPYRLLTKDGVCELDLAGRKFLQVEPAVLKRLARQAFADVSFYLRRGHLQKLREELNDPEASENDRFVIYTHLMNAVTAAAGEVPICQDTGTAI